MILLYWCLRIYLWVGLVSISMCSVSLLYCKPLPGRRRKWHNSARGGKTGQRTNIHSTAFNIHCYWPIFQSCLPYHQPRDQLLTQFKMRHMLFNAVAHCGFSFDILTFVRITSYSCGFCGCLIPNLSRAFYSHLFPVFFSPHRTFTFIFVALSLTFNFFFSFSFYFDPLKFFISTGVKASWTLELVGFHLNVFGNISPKTSINNVLLNILATQRSVL